MATSGRKSKLKLVPSGKTPKLPAEMPAALTRPPDGLPEAGKDLWKRAAPEFRRLGLLSPATLPGFYALCLTWGIAMDAAQTVRTDGLTIEGVNDTAKKHPAATILREFLSDFRMWCGEYGLTPSALQRLKILPQEELDAMEEVLNRRPGK